MGRRENGMFKNGRKVTVTQMHAGCEEWKSMCVQGVIRLRRWAPGFNCTAQCMIQFQVAYAARDVSSEEGKSRLIVCSLSYLCGGNSMLTVLLPGSVSLSEL